MKKIIRLTESDLHRVIKESVRKIIKEWGDRPQFVIKSLAVNGNDVSDEFFSSFGQTFTSKYDFASNLREFLSQYGITPYDVDTANDFGEEGDSIYINTNSDDYIEAHGGYEDFINKDYARGIKPGINL
jgi:hypothetical protein